MTHDEITCKALAEVGRLNSILAQTLAALHALSPNANADLDDAGYARLWNATIAMLESEAP